VGRGRGEINPENKHDHAKSDIDRSFWKSNPCKWLKELGASERVR
jgi:hypothetical protein